MIMVTVQVADSSHENFMSSYEVVTWSSRFVSSQVVNANPSDSGLSEPV